MVKLSKKQAQAVDQAEVQDIGPIPEGRYKGRLREVRKEEGNKGPYLRWEFDEIRGMQDGKKYPGHQWVNTSLSDNALWKVKETFLAFGVPASTDTDDLVGQEVGMVVSRSVIESGKRAGEIGNNVDRLFNLDDAEGASEDSDDDDEDEDIF